MWRVSVSVSSVYLCCVSASCAWTGSGVGGFLFLSSSSCCLLTSNNSNCQRQPRSSELRWRLTHTHTHTHSLSLSYRSQSLQRWEAFLPGCGWFLERFVSFDQFLHLVHTLSHLPAGQIWLLSQQPCLCHAGVPWKLVHFQNCTHTQARWKGKLKSM